jgi:hypothetical protein
VKIVEIDDDVFAYIQGKASYPKETPNSIFRRLLGCDNRPAGESDFQHATGRKKPSANLNELVKAGLIREGQRLILRNYQGHNVKGCDAFVSQGKLSWKGKLYSMSCLAKELLKQQGYESGSVRGPKVWFNKDGVSIKDMWEQYQERQNQRLCKS